MADTSRVSDCYCHDRARTEMRLTLGFLVLVVCGFAAKLLSTCSMPADSEALRIFKSDVAVSIMEGPAS